MTQPKQTKQRDTHKVIASMRGNLRQLLCIPDDQLTERQRKIIIKINGKLATARQHQIDLSRRQADRLEKLSKESVPFENESLTLMVIYALSCLTTDTGYIPGIRLKALADDNPLMTGKALDGLAALNYIRRHQDGALTIDERGLYLMNKHKKTFG
jgi:hypothetical protein